MSVSERAVSSLPKVIPVIVLCAASYWLGAMRAADKQPEDKNAETVVATAGSASDASPIPRPEVRAMLSAPEGGRNSSGVRTNIEAEQRERLMRNISENLAIPGMNQIIQEQQRVLMGDKYRSLIKTLGLNAGEEGYLLDLLTARQMLQVDMGMKLMTGMMSEAERSEMIGRVHSGMAELEKEIDWFLNNGTDSDYLRYYDKTEGERATVVSVGSAVEQAGHPFADGVEEVLVAILYEELTRYPFSVNLEENGEPVFSNFTDANINIFIQELEQLRGPVFQQASSVLDPSQLEIFENYFSRYVEFYDQRLRMAQQFFNPEQ